MWNRKGTVYQLTPHGWLPANCDGYADGLPVSEAFDTAKRAFSFMQRGAIYSAYAMLANIDLQRLRTEYNAIAAASFLTVLKKGPVVEEPMVKDLEALGLFLCGDDVPTPQHPDVTRVGGYLVHKRFLTDAQACRLYLALPQSDLPEWVHDQAVAATKNQYIPSDKLNLRSPWIPKPLIAHCLGWKLNQKGLYVGQNRGLERYLNYGKDGGIITDTDQEIFELASQQFAIEMNNHDSPKFAATRTKIHAHFLVHNAPKLRVQEAFMPVESALPLHDWQVNDVDFYLSGATISNLDVGLGKTLTALRAAVAHCANGAKALITVPKQVLSKWGATLDRFFPAIRWSIWGFRETAKGKLARLPRTELTDQAKGVFFDPGMQIILTSHQVFGEFKVNESDRLQADMANAFDQIGADMTATAVKARAVFVKQAGRRTYHNGGEITFSDLPQGLLVVVDEAHNYKGLFGMPYSGWGESLIMAGQCGESLRAYEMQVKCDIIRARGGKTLALTATVINNSVAEIYNMLRIFAPQALKQHGIKNTQQLMDYFCTIEPITTVSLTGEVKQGQTITGFRNVDELQRMWDSCMISKTAQDVDLALPEYQEIIERVEPTDDINEFMDYWKGMLDQLIKKGDIEGASPKAADDEEKETVGMLRIIGMIDKVACFPPQCGVKSNPKFAHVATNVLKHYKSHDGQQIIFADQKDVQQALCEHLVSEGIPLEKIVIINADTAPNASDRLAIQDAFNRGEYRVAIGGKVISEGIDLQENTIAAHFLNLAWEGGTIHQRKGRLIRQGNRNAKVFVYYYLLSGSTDDYRFLTVSNKTHWGDALRKTQSNNLDQGVFSEPVDDEFLCALALNPAEIRQVLKNRRKMKELVKQVNKAEKLFRTLLRFANPKTRTHALEILQKYEAKLEKLEFVPAGLVAEGIKRVQALAHLHDARIQDRARFKNWARWVKDDTTLVDYSTPTYGYSKLDCFTINLDEDGNLYWYFTDLSEYLRPELHKTLPTFPDTFGDLCPIRDQPSLLKDTAAQPSLKLVVIETQTEAKSPVLEPAQALAKPAETPTKQPQAMAADSVASDTAKTKLTALSPARKLDLQPEKQPQKVAAVAETDKGRVSPTLPTEKAAPTGANGAARLLPNPSEQAPVTTANPDQKTVKPKRLKTTGPVIAASSAAKKRGLRPSQPRQETKRKTKTTTKKHKKVRPLRFGSDAQPCLFSEQELFAATLQPIVSDTPNNVIPFPVFGHSA